MTESKPLIVAGADGFGEDLKNVLVEHCRAQGYEVDDLGTGAYYDKAGEVARRVQTDGAKGLLWFSYWPPASRHPTPVDQKYGDGIIQIRAPPEVAEAEAPIIAASLFF